MGIGGGGRSTPPWGPLTAGGDVGDIDKEKKLFTGFTGTKVTSIVELGIESINYTYNN